MAKQRDKLERAIIISIILHGLFFGALFLGSIFQPIEMDVSSGGAIDAIMVDPNVVKQQYQRMQQLKDDAKRAQEISDNLAKRQTKELQNKQLAEQEQLKKIEKERIDAERKAKQIAEQKRVAQEETEKALAAKKLADAEVLKAKAETEKQRVEAEREKTRAEVERKAAEQEKAKAEAERKSAAKAAEEKRKAEQALKEAKAKEDQLKAAAETRKKEEAISNLFDDLASDKNAPADRSATNKSNDSGVSNALVDSYKGQIKNAIENKLTDSQLFRGKSCNLRIKLAPDGMLVSAEFVEGDQALCRIAMIAARQANIPRPPNKLVYEEVKNAVLVFKPE